MVRLASAILAGSALALAWFAAESAARAQEASQVVGVASVVDGDTIEIHEQSIRLSGFDAPEQSRMCGRVNVNQRAALALSDVLGRQTVSCAITGRDDSRAIGHCSVGGVDLGDQVVSRGWARDWPRHSGGRYAKAEAEAREARRGIWGLACGSDVWSNRDYSWPDTPPQASSPARLAPVEGPTLLAYVSASALNMRVGPGRDEAIISRLSRGDLVALVERQGGWSLVRIEDREGWVASSYLSLDPPQRRVTAQRAQGAVDARRALITESIASYYGSCPCPYSVDRAGRRCGGRSAYSRPGGASPLCYPSDVSEAQVRAFLAR